MLKRIHYVTRVGSLFVLSRPAMRFINLHFTHETRSIILQLLANSASLQHSSTEAAEAQVCCLQIPSVVTFFNESNVLLEILWRKKSIDLWWGFEFAMHHYTDKRDSSLTWTVSSFTASVSDVSSMAGEMERNNGNEGTKKNKQKKIYKKKRERETEHQTKRVKEKVSMTKLKGQKRKRKGQVLCFSCTLRLGKDFSNSFIL